MRPTTQLSWPSSRSVSLAGVLGRRGFALESAAARVCREAGGRVTTNVLVQDMDLLPLRQVDNRRLEVVVDGLPLFRGAQLAIDTTMVSPVSSDGTARRQCAATNGAALDQARRQKPKQRNYAKLLTRNPLHGSGRLPPRRTWEWRHQLQHTDFPAKTKKTPLLRHTP